MSSISIDVWSDLDMNCPQSYYGGFKEGRLLTAGDAERALSDWFTGDWTGSTYRFSIADHDARVRGQLASLADRYWSRPLSVRMTTRANRAVLGRPYTVMVGPIIDAQPTFPLGWDVTIGDIVSHGILSDRLQLPWRLVRDGFLQQLVAISERLDRDQAEPIIYGIHDRIPGDHGSPGPDSPSGFRIVPTYLGIEKINGDDAHVWMVAGHACKSVQIFVDGVEQTESVGWLIPGQPNWTSEIGAATYVDKVSDTYGVNRRYTLIYGYLNGTLEAWFKHRTSIPSRCAVGDLVLTCEVAGVEDTGDGTGDLIRDRFQQYKHFLVNFVASQGPDSYQSGAWLDNREWSALDLTVPIVDESSFDDASEIAVDRIGGSPDVGYVGSAAIGIKAGDRSSARRWIADWNRSCGCRFGISHLGEMRVVMLHPTQAIKDAAPLFTDNYEILQGTFQTNVGWDSHATAIAYRTDYDSATGQWNTEGVVSDSQSETRWERSIPSEVRDYPFAPGEEQAAHLALLELRLRANPPRIIRFENAITTDGVDDNEAAYLDLGDYFRYVHYDAVTEEREIRLAQVVRHQVKGSPRTILIEGFDCDDFIGYDSEGSPSGSWDGSP